MVNQSNNFPFQRHALALALALVTNSGSTHASSLEINDGTLTLNENTIYSTGNISNIDQSQLTFNNISLTSDSIISNGGDVIINGVISGDGIAGALTQSTTDGSSIAIHSGTITLDGNTIALANQLNSNQGQLVLSQISGLTVLTESSVSLSGVISGLTLESQMDVSGTCTLTNAINNANTDTDTDGAGGCPAGNGADVLNLAANKTYLLKAVDNNFAGPNGLPLVTSEITINGHNAAIKRSNATGIDDFRILQVANNGKLTVNDLKVTGGSLSVNNQYGSGILNNGQLTLNNTKVFHNNGVSSSGVANMYHSSLTMSNSMVLNNTGASGSGVINFPGSNATITNSTITGNISTQGFSSGVFNSGVMTLTNSTVSGNRTQTNWGTAGIVNHSNAVLTLNHVTVFGNGIDAGDVAGISNSGTLILANSIVAHSKNGSDCYTDNRYGGKTLFQGQTIIGDGSCNPPLSGDPKLGALLDNGGPTYTFALRNDSPAINGASGECPATDQRNVSRPQPAQGRCQIGAFQQVLKIPSSVKTLVDFYNQQVNNQTIVGYGLNSGSKINAIRNQLLAAGDYKNNQLNLQACSQLYTTLTRLDANNSPTPYDYITGSQVSVLVDNINSLRADWQCNSSLIK